MLPIPICQFKNSTLVKPSLTQILSTHLSRPCGSPSSPALLSLNGKLSKSFSVCFPVHPTTYPLFLFTKIWWWCYLMPPQCTTNMLRTHRQNILQQSEMHQMSYTTLLVCHVLLMIAHQYNAQIKKQLWMLKHKCNGDEIF